MKLIHVFRSPARWISYGRDGIELPYITFLCNMCGSWNHPIGCSKNEHWIPNWRNVVGERASTMNDEIQ